MITNDWVIFEPNRDKRPTEFKAKEVDEAKVFLDRPPHKDGCPFCSGNEKQDDKEIFRMHKNGTIIHSPDWQIRIVENKFASLNRETPLEFHNHHHHLRKEMSGFGIHDVIIDHPSHNKTIGIMSQEEVETLIRAYHHRYCELRKLDHVRHVVIFKNQGISAGGSLEHPHSQIYGLPVVPFEASIRMKEVEKYYDFNNNCMFCDMIRDERECKERIIDENEHFLSWVPYAAVSPYHIWVVPKQHAPSFALLKEEEISSLAAMMKSVLSRVFWGLRNPDYNFIMQSLTRFESDNHGYHWYISIIPHVKKKGGLSYAGGVQLNPMMPEAAAEKLRQAKPD